MPFFFLLCRFRFLTLAVLPFTLIAENLREVGNMLLGKRKRPIPRWVAGAVFLICILAMMLFLASEVTPRRDQLRLEARINGGEMALDEGYDYGGALTLTAVLPEWESRWYPLLEIRYADEAEVFLDGEIIGRMEEWDRKMLGNAVFMLPQGCAGKTVTLATTKEEGEPLPFLYITDSGIVPFGECAVPAPLYGGAGNTDTGAVRTGKHGEGTACSGAGERRIPPPDAA